ncbi:MAG: hypothetical protein WAK91_13525 [Candidatus Acidiferrales bacterium]|jgi:hypothetical protein
MDKPDQAQITAAKERVLHEQYAESGNERCEFEERLDEIANHIEKIHTSPCHALNAEAPEAFEPTVELRVKAEAARWMLRVAKHLAEPTRERVLSAVKRSLDDLEKIVASHTEPVTGSAHHRKAHAAHATAGR